MKRLVLLSLFVLSMATTAHAQVDCNALSPNAQYVGEHWFGTAEPLPLQGYQLVIDGVTRRFPTTALTFRIVDNPLIQGGTYSAGAKTGIRNSARMWVYLMNNDTCGNNITLTEVPATDNTALITFLKTTSGEQSMLHN